jgi:thiazole synthase ThiGH ThiG subunit
MSVRRWRPELTARSARNSRTLRERPERTPHIPVIVDAGSNLPSQACQVMEWTVLLKRFVAR